MMTFFTILVVLIGLNVAMVIASLQNASKKSKRPTRMVSEDNQSVIYPIDLITSNYKKAV
ncbi:MULTISPECIES: hypothetical protein [Maribacter]|uniref:Uncharacterized protein n=1 Tax=Maribacter flavus TaxID=1658664 RepID=A0A5B2TX62_9FLAO|nr:MULTISPECIES: hypothetical protein [Maribacter]KAA2218210.1 hypothetical protein F0361_00910 [Maribacter flavus]MDC6405071.1 hypothetical protein [Maribacter sp. PR66]MEE1972485.1 hypothetical protein [Maribacter flavus]